MSDESKKSENPNPWLAMTGWLKDDPLYDEWQRMIRRYRNKCNRDAGINLKKLRREFMTETVEGAITQLMEFVPGAVRGSTATHGHPNYQRLAQAVLAAGEIKECRCGMQKLGWTAPEFIATEDGTTWSVGYDANTNKISCGPIGYHSERYGNELPCC